MLDTKDFYISFDVKDTLSACKNKEKFITSEFNRLYKNKCFKGVFIKSIIEIPYIGNCQILLNSFKFIGQINAHIICEVITYNIGLEFLSNVKIIKTEPNIEGIHPFAKISISGLPPVRKDDIVTILIYRVIYPPGHKIIIIGKLITCITPPKLPSYKLYGKLTIDNIINLKQLSNQLDYKINDLKLDKNAEKYIKLLYPYKTQKKIPNNTFTITNIIKDIKKYDLDDNIWTSDDSIGKELGMINKVSDDIIDSKPIDIYVFLHMFLLRTILFCDIITEMTKLNNTPKHIELYMKKFQK